MKTSNYGTIYFENNLCIDQKSERFVIFIRQFLLELLTERKYRNIIEWVENDGKFKLTDHREVAKIWGERKQNKYKIHKMCYDNFSRSLRYCYKKNILTKINCGKYVYQFVFNIKDVVGYHPQQLHDLVNDRARRYPN